MKFFRCDSFALSLFQHTRLEKGWFDVCTSAQRPCSVSLRRRSHHNRKRSRGDNEDN
ncbi:hypothetical protein HBI56_175840 [Parastagonospora nodorum]|uniref:Uncharacterized protein n=1 Tax=Phaeosphaeria nodorum (strain SN15 / ATCC MYA-4574 / FGSC 10173) TaxID=321614 RepID=A0A7U2I596_PHANO|nr:hypothetical protein HBH56_121300 [Parastagonospora nodorum]QRD03906.1 hypothetical protein JI435_420460 [Parastagonospora nodorum SN15]KAH3924240.1 hypothetical protein HBH54_197200 [Parastagonospora nodorum]KAH3942512.1 hypothetical protein HBH53_186330 [Parastagonospora nodorum]KAH3961649.1 hypothetical protein HBH51_181510 [Parastagonospora nodorum]